MVAVNVTVVSGFGCSPNINDKATTTAVAINNNKITKYLYF
jgi:hypothetical protein